MNGGALRRLGRLGVAVLCGLAFANAPTATAARPADETFDANPTYDIGKPALSDLWVDPVAGDDAAAGTTREKALRSLQAALARVPRDLKNAATGYRIRLAAGSYAMGARPGLWLDGRRGTRDHPLLIESADGPQKAVLPPLTLATCSYAYLIGVKIASSEKSPRDILLHLVGSDHVLVRNVVAVAAGTTRESLPFVNCKCDQSQYLYVEDCEFDGADVVDLDFVACQFGHIVRSKFHRSFLEGVTLKGGSAGFVVAGNEIWDSRVFGFCAGEGTGFQYMVKPWIHYEAYDLKFVNNVIHDTGGPAVSVAGGYNILVAHNTCVRVAQWNSPISVGYGARGPGSGQWDATCDDYLKAGGWCAPRKLANIIPSKNVYVLNNLVFNDTFGSERASFGIAGPLKTPEGSNLPSEVRADDGLILRGNAIRNGPAKHPALGPVADGAPPGYDEAVLTKENSIHLVALRLAGDFRAVKESLADAPGAAIPDFAGGDLPRQPAAPQGTLCNQPSCDRAGVPRTSRSPGAWQP